jgi:hypothetical protein
MIALMVGFSILLAVVTAGWWIEYDRRRTAEHMAGLWRDAAQERARILASIRKLVG